MTQGIAIISRRSDHRRVVGAQRKRWNMHFEFVLRLKRLTQWAVCRDATCNQDFFSVEVPRRLDCFREQGIDDRRLE